MRQIIILHLSIFSDFIYRQSRPPTESEAVKLLTYSLTAIFSLSLIACAESTLEDGFDYTTGESSNLSTEEVTQGWDAMNAVLNAGTRSEGQALAGFDFDHSFSHACPDGGTADFSGTVSAEWAIGAAGADFTYTVGFSNCSAYGVSIDGSMDYSRSASVQDTTLETSFEWSGDVSWSGLVSGDCAVDVTGSTSASLVDWNFEAESETSGTVCGYDASNEISIDF